MSLLYHVPPLPQQEGMISRPELGRPLDCLDKVPRDHTGRRPISPCGLSWVWEGNPCLFDRQTGDHPPRDLCRGPLKEGREEYIPQHILHHLEGHPYIRGDALHEGPLLLEGLLQARVCGLWVPTLHLDKEATKYRQPSAFFHSQWSGASLVPKKPLR